MKVFIIWSGEKSKAVAFKLHQLISDMIQAVKPFLSLEDLDAGARWNEEIAKELSETKFGIICLTKSNTEAPYVLFEAGAVAKTVDDNTHVCPYLIDMESSDIPKGPLTQFQWKKANEEQTLELLKTINKALGDDALPESSLKRTFDKFWTDLNDVLESLPDEATANPEKRPKEEMIEEILDEVRSMSRRITSYEVSPSGLMIPTRRTGLGSPIGEGGNSTIPRPPLTLREALTRTKRREITKNNEIESNLGNLGLKKRKKPKADNK